MRTPTLLEHRLAAPLSTGRSSSKQEERQPAARPSPPARPSEVPSPIVGAAGCDVWPSEHHPSPSDPLAPEHTPPHVPSSGRVASREMSATRARPILRTSAELYGGLGLALTYDPNARGVTVEADLGMCQDRVGGGT